ncbi:MAG: hypothetical protein EVA48_04870 [Gammaproteobacteria bacterium]|nr:MAG: hypothetical protein EVA48_04870 [Gammaproteobacteria bacterium]
MKDEDVLFRSIQGIAYVSITPLIVLTSSLWFTSDNVAYFLAHSAQIYFSVLLFFLSGNIWSIRSSSNENLKKQLTFFSLIPFISAIFGGLLTIFINPISGILFLLSVVYVARHINFINSIISLFDSSYKELINKISIILCICLMLIFTYWINPYTYPIEIYN